MLKAKYFNISEDNLPASDKEMITDKHLENITMLDYVIIDHCIFLCNICGHVQIAVFICLHYRLEYKSSLSLY